MKKQLFALLVLVVPMAFGSYDRYYNNPASEYGQLTPAQRARMQSYLNEATGRMPSRLETELQYRDAQRQARGLTEEQYDYFTKKPQSNRMTYTHDEEWGNY